MCEDSLLVVLLPPTRPHGVMLKQTLKFTATPNRKHCPISGVVQNTRQTLCRFLVVDYELSVQYNAIFRKHASYIEWGLVYTETFQFNKLKACFT